MIEDRLDVRCLQIIEIVLEGLSLHFEVAEYFIGFGGLKGLDLFGSWHSFELDDFGDLVDGVLSGKQGASTIKFVDKTAQTPHVAFG